MTPHEIQISTLRDQIAAAKATQARFARHYAMRDPSYTGLVEEAIRAEEVARNELAALERTGEPSKPTVPPAVVKSGKAAAKRFHDALTELDAATAALIEAGKAYRTEADMWPGVRVLSAECGNHIIRLLERHGLPQARTTDQPLKPLTGRF